MTPSESHSTLNSQVLQLLVKNAPRARLVTDEQGVITLWNDAAAELTQIPAGDALGQFAWDVLHRLSPAAERTPAALEQRRTVMLAALRDGATDEQSRPTTSRIERADGATLDLETRFFTIRTDHGYQASMVLGNVTAEREDARWRKVLTQAVEQSPVTVIITDAAGVIEYANARLTELTGYTLDEVKGKTSRVFKSDLTPRATHEELWSTITSGQSWHGDLCNRKKNGELFWERLNISPLFDEQGRIQHFVNIKEDITERRQAEQALRESEERFRSLVQSTDDVVYTLDLQQRHTGIYGRWLTRSGLKAEHFLGRTAREILGDAGAEAHESAFQRALTGGGAVYEWSSGGQHFQTSLAPLHDADGRICGLVGIGRDITELHQAQEQLHGSAQFLRSTLDSLSNEVVILDDQGVILTYNEAFRAYTTASVLERGASLDGLNYFTVLQQVAQDPDRRFAAHRIEADLRAVIAQEQDACTMEYRRQLPGGVRWYRVQISRFWQGDALRVVISRDDITALKQAQLAAESAHAQLAEMHEALRRQNDQLEATVEQRTAQLRALNDRMVAILNSSSDAIVVVDGSDRIESANPAFHGLFGYAEGETVGQPLTVLAEPASASAMQQTDATVRATLEPQRLQIPVRRKDGQSFDADIALSFIRENSGHLVVSIRDITQIKTLERAKDAFLSMVNHEIRTPITAIVTSAETLQHYYERMTVEKRLEKVQQIFHQAQGLFELVTDILDLTRIEAQRSLRQEEAVDVGRVVHQVVDELASQAESKGQRLEVTTDARPVLPAGSATEIARIWRNLIGNAVKYSGDGSVIQARVRVEEPDSAVAGTRRLVGVVSDNGPGIPAEELPLLFTRFFRGRAAQTTITGSGLGLALVREIVKSYGGDVAVESAPVQGTTFTFWLPI